MPVPHSFRSWAMILPNCWVRTQRHSSIRKICHLKAPSGTRLSVTENEVAKVEDLIRQVVSPQDLGMIVSNIGSTPDFSAIYTTNSAMHTAFVQVSLKEDHKVGSYEYMARLKQKLAREVPELTAYFQSGGLVDAVLNMGMPD